MNKDRLTRRRRSWNMSRIRGKDTTPEGTVRSLLHQLGYRFRLHVRKLPGCPDIVLPKYRTAVFVHGCFWHRHRGCKNCTTPTHRRAWWLAKLNGNAARDRRHQDALKKLGWHCVVVWECETEDPRRLERILIAVTRRLRPQIPRGVRFPRAGGRASGRKARSTPRRRDATPRPRVRPRPPVPTPRRRTA